MRTILVVGNETLDSPTLADALAERIAAGPCRVHVLVPATPSREHAFWTEGQALSAAHERLDRLLLSMADADAVVTGQVGDASVLAAVDDALLHDRYDEIILSTWPPGVSRWIRQDLPHRLARHTDLPVHHVVAAPADAGVP
jgi:hypothetical protein